jgi:pantetheine-phosphate adenylyltransferase
VAVGGTFDKFHYGHRKLLETAFGIGENVVIGVTSDNFAKKKGDIESCDIRMSNLNKFLSEYHNNFSISRLDDAYGITICDENFDAIVVSEETEPNAVKINEIRKDKGMKQIDIIVISYVFAKDDIPISSTRIRKGEIDIKGNIL